MDKGNIIDGVLLEKGTSFRGSIGREGDFF